MGWASQLHQSTGNVSTAVNIGYHKDEVWYNVLFQMAVGLNVMQINNISFNGFDVRKNVFIKDIKHDTNQKKHWRYKLDDYTFYIPNHGHIVMIDTNFKDVRPEEYKIWSEIYENNNLANDKDEEIKKIKSSVFEQFIKSFDPNIFQTKNIIRPSEEVINFMREVHQDALNKLEGENISDYIKKHFKMFVNNRIGTVLSSSEKNNVRDDLPLTPKPGNIFARLVQNGKYEFVLFHKRIGPQQAEVFTRVNDNLDRTIVRIDELSNYEGEVYQKFKSGKANLNKDGILEVYNIKTQS